MEKVPKPSNSEDYILHTYYFFFFYKNQCIAKNSPEAVLHASKKVGLALNARETKCILMSRSQSSEQGHNMKTDNVSFDNVGIFQLTWSFQPHYGLCVDSASNRNEYQESS
jgi:hypothetical protein